MRKEGKGLDRQSWQHSIDDAFVSTAVEMSGVFTSSQLWVWCIRYLLNPSHYSVYGGVGELSWCVE